MPETAGANMLREVVSEMGPNLLLALLAIIVTGAPLSSVQTRRAASSPQSQMNNQAGSVDAAAAFEEGQSAHQRGDLTNAVRLYTEAISADKTLYQAYYQRAVALMTMNKRAEAEADLQKVIELQPGFARAHRTLGLLLLDQDKTDDAKREFAKALEQDPGLSGTRIYYASALIKSGEPAKAVEHLRMAIAQNEDVGLAHALLGLALERTGNSAEAYAEYDKAVAFDPNNATALEGRARMLVYKGEIAKAIEDYSAAYRLQPSRDVALKLADLHARAGQTQAAIGLYRKLLLDRSDDLAVRAELARLLGESGQEDEAKRLIRVVLNLKPKDRAYLTIAGDLFFKEQPDVAAEYYRQALAVDPTDNRARVQLGASLVRSMQFEPALGVLTEALTRDADNYAAHANLATALFKLKRYPDAAREFLWVIRAKPEIPASYFFLAISFDKLGDCQQSLKCYVEFVRRADPASNKNELLEANTRIAQLERLIKEKKCASGSHKGK
jgi:tetratricopeptide (TPR) repeat protein